MTEPNAYQQNPYQQSNYGIAPKKPPLTKELKRAASVAGAVSFTVMSIGWWLASTAVGIGLFAGFFVWVFGLIGASGEGRDADYFRLMDVIEAINPGAWVIPLVIATLVGVGLWVWSLFISRGMLAKAGHPSPWGVTWAGTGIAIAASWIVSWVAWLPLQAMSFMTPNFFDSWESGLVMALVLGGASLLLGLVVTVGLGWLAWWWMAHAMRPATQPA
jgi:hypothetical protein